MRPASEFLCRVVALSLYGAALCAGETVGTPLHPSPATKGDIDPATGSVVPDQPERPQRGDGKQGPPQPSRSGGNLLGIAAPAPLEVPLSSESNDREPGEILLFSDSLEQAEHLREKFGAKGAVIRSRVVLKYLGGVLSRFRVPRDTDPDTWLTTLAKTDPVLQADANHRYRPATDDPHRYGQTLTALDSADTHCGNGITIGLIDTGVDTGHPVFRGRGLTSRSFLRPGEIPAPRDHATAIAALLVGGPDQGPLAGMVPGARLAVAAVFRRRGEQIDTSADRLIHALDWLLGQHVRVVNLSLSGPANRLLERALATAAQRGLVMLAAVGNQGPQRPPGYPAAYADVVAVTAVNARRQVFARANRGNTVDFAAPGVDIWVARAGGGAGFASGTSYAVPFATALVIRMLAASLPPERIYERLRASALDLGARGRDPSSGWGLVRESGMCRSSVRLRR